MNNRRLIPRDSVIAYLDKKGLLNNTAEARQDLVYVRVSTHKQKERGDLQRQVQRVSEFAAFQNPVNLCVIEDVGSGLNDGRKGLTKLLTLVMQDKVGRIFVNYKDRLTCFGFNYIKLLCDFHNTQIIVVSSEMDNKTVSEELAEDIIAIIHSFSGKLYGLRRTVKDSIDKELSVDGFSGDTENKEVQ